MPILIIIFCAFFSQITAQTATFYHDKYEGRKTANGDIFHQDGMTCASNDYPIGTLLRVFYNGKSIDVRVNDRLKNGTKNVIDLTSFGFGLLSDTSKGRIKIKIKPIKK